jgi:hypothetical protein
VDPNDLVAAATLSWQEAWLAAGRLRADGIPALVYPNDYSPYSRFGAIGGPLAVGSAGPVRGFQVIVRKKDLEQARRLLEVDATADPPQADS